MTASEFNKSLRTISRGIYDMLGVYGLQDELSDNNRNNPEFFAPNLNKLQRKELAWLGNDYESKYDIIAEAFTNLMISKNPFVNYVKKGEKGHKSDVEPWLNLIMQRELSRLSQQQFKKRTKEIKENNVFKMDDESASEAFDRLVNKYDSELERKFTVEEEIAFEKLMDKIKKELKREANFEVYHLILDMLFVGMSKSEIAKILGVSSAKVSQRLKKIKEAISEVADYYKSRGDDTLSNMLTKYIKASVIGNRNVERDVSMLMRQLITSGITIRSTIFPRSSSKTIHSEQDLYDLSEDEVGYIDTDGYDWSVKKVGGDIVLYTDTTSNPQVFDTMDALLDYLSSKGVEL